MKEFGDKIETTYLENVSEGPDSERADRATRARRQQADLHDVVRLHGPDAQGRQEISRTCIFEHATGYKRDKNVATYSARLYQGRYIQGQIAAKMSKAGVLGYIGSFPIPEVISGINATMLGAQIDQSEHQDQDHLGEFLVRSGQGSRRRQGVARSGRRHADAAHRQPGGDADRFASAASWRSARIPT